MAQAALTNTSPPKVRAQRGAPRQDYGGAGGPSWAKAPATLAPLGPDDEDEQPAPVGRDLSRQDSPGLVGRDLSRQTAPAPPKPAPMTATAAAPQAQSAPVAPPPVAMPAPPPQIETETPSLWDALAPNQDAPVVRVHRVRDGHMQAALFAVPANTPPDAFRAKLLPYGAGEYQIMLIHKGKTQTQTRYVLAEEDIPQEARKPVAMAAVPAAAPALDVAALVAGMQAIAAQQQAAFTQAMQQMQLQQVQGQNELLKSLLPAIASHGGQGGGAGMTRMVETLLAHALTQKQSEPDPLDRVMRLLDVTKRVREETDPPAPTNDATAVYVPLAQGFASLMGHIANHQAAAPPAPRPLVRVANGKVIGVQAAKPAPAPVAAAAAAPPSPPTPKPVGHLPPDLLAQIKPYAAQLAQMAASNAEPAHVLGLLLAALPEAQQIAALNTLIDPQTLPALLADVPELQPHRAWLTRVVDEAQSWVNEAGSGLADDDADKDPGDEAATGVA